MCPRLAERVVVKHLHLEELGAGQAGSCEADVQRLSPRAPLRVVLRRPQSGALRHAAPAPPPPDSHTPTPSDPQTPTHLHTQRSSLHLQMFPCQLARTDGEVTHNY
eukprot:401476-Prorocentrum_minimum.AAC.5